MKEILTDISSDRMVLTVAGKIIRASTTPLARNTDPATSKEAAEKCETFKARHISLIWQSLKDKGAMIPAEIARATGLDYHAVQRRMSEMRDKKLIERLPETRYGQHIVRAIHG